MDGQLRVNAERMNKCNKPQRGGWAPGNYICHCSQCDQDFIGDKRAVVCADCAYRNNDGHQ